MDFESLYDVATPDEYPPTTWHSIKAWMLVIACFSAVMLYVAIETESTELVTISIPSNISLSISGINTCKRTTASGSDMKLYSLHLVPGIYAVRLEGDNINLETKMNIVKDGGARNCFIFLNGKLIPTKQ